MTAAKPGAELERLAVRVESAGGADRRLDTQIFIRLDPDAQHIVGHEPGRFPQEAIYGPRTDFWEWACDETKDPPVFAVIPAYTASLDAAMTLVPEGWGWSVDSIGVAKACEDHNGVGPVIEASASTPALALTAAALRARATKC